MKPFKGLDPGTLADTDPDFAERIQSALRANDRHEMADKAPLAAAYRAGKIRVWPADAILPDDFQDALQDSQTAIQHRSDCSTSLSDCVLMAVELNNQAPTEWI
jgi:hypothetical protein